MGGDLPLFCTEQKKNINSYYYVLQYRRTLPAPLEISIKKRARVFKEYTVDESSSILQICPYMKNFLTAQWRSTLRKHFAKLNCAFAGVNVTFSMPYDVEEKLKALLDWKEEGITFVDKPWYEAWLNAYENNLSIEKKTKYRRMKKSLVIERFERIRKHQRKNVPYEFLRKRTELVQCV